ncbi:circularly permuted type 2 ATP-grasp protein [Heliobacillus mobilis]|uniref:Circularly permuted type 2 ATP-grasp protein n=1 Tax=Heliobacterium mobile TaxID=28064 RepID=A0A6I3SI74_HELMO|nr:circularly permuted type 2 ATP-grasp protein [Heliobacterium mobile]MTV48593.1 circularly permuted type 2 ATP-grasp protein [Heliobacterium mobile]
MFQSRIENDCYNEMFSKNDCIRPLYENVFHYFERLSPQTVTEYYWKAQHMLHNMGVTFTVYQESSSLERTLPFDILPRLISFDDWNVIEQGCLQRVRALNAFLYDIYHNQEILHERIVPRELVVTHQDYCWSLKGLNIPGNQYVTLAGIDIIRDPSGKYVVLEDNLRVPSGISYIFENRRLMERLFPDLCRTYPIRPILPSLSFFGRYLHSLSPRQRAHPTVVLLTPGKYNSAYYDHIFLAQQMGIPLVEGNDLLTLDNQVFMRTVHGLQKVDVIYRRIDDDFLDPLVFRPDSVLGVAGLMSAYRAGNVALANAPGTGVADDKAIYTYVPQMIRYYLNERPILDNVTTYRLDDPDECAFVLKNINQMVVKKTTGAGGYGMLIGPRATEEEIRVFSTAMMERPKDYIAQPTINFSQHPSFVDGDFEGRHIDLRPFVIGGEVVIPGGLTRVALPKGSLVVNSSQGGGSKDTWVV